MKQLDPTYREALVKSWQFVWQHKILWLIGMMGAIFSQFGLNDFVGQVVMIFNSNSLEEVWYSPLFWKNLEFPHGVQLIGTIWLAIIALAFVALIVVAAVCAEGSLIAASCRWFKNRTRPSLRLVWKQGVKHFWNLIAINILQKFCLAALLVFLTLFLSSTSVPSNMVVPATVLVLLVLVLCALAVTSIATYAAGYVVEKEYSFGEALQSAVQMFSEHVLVSLELSTILLLSNIVLFLAILGSSILVLIPSAFIWIIGGFTGYSILLVVGLVLAVSLMLILIALFGAIFNAFTTSAWMFLFMKMHVKGVPSRIAHYAKRVVRRA
jgi:hypothetical protein